jgi:serine/threonine-protein kinase ATR
MDHFSRWIRDRQKAQGPVNENGGSRRRESSTDAAIIRVKSIMTQISPELIASAALYCKDHARALLNIEQQILKLEGGQISSGQSLIVNEAAHNISPEQQLQKYYEKAHEIYASVDEPDGMEGISAKITAPSIPHQIREHESTGRWTSAQSCWEVQLQRNPDELRSHVGLLRCLRNLGHYGKQIITFQSIHVTIY